MNSILRNSLFVFVAILCSCYCQPIEDPTEKEYVQPEWEIKIPTFDSEFIYYNGLPNLPCCNNQMLAHTTVYDGGMGREDNRLCSVDLMSGTIQWYFPSNISERHYCSFDRNGFIYNNKVVFQYRPDARSDEDRLIHSTVCIDAATGKPIWEESSKSDDNRGRVRDVVGYGSKCYFVKDSSVISIADLDNDNVTDFYDADTLNINDLSICDNYLVLTGNIKAKAEFKYNVYAIVLDCRTGEEILFKYIATSGIQGYSRIANEMLYCSVDNYILSADLKTGQTVWSNQEPGLTAIEPFTITSDVIVKYGSDSIIAYNSKNGNILYKITDYTMWYVGIDSNLAYIINGKGHLDVMDILSGSILDSTKCKYSDRGEYFSGASPVIYDNKLYIMSYNHLFRYPTYPWP